MRPIDPQDLARFMLKSTASRFVTALASIPDGPLDESVALMAEQIAAQYAAVGLPDPLQRIAPDPVAALSGPRRGSPRTDDPAVAAVQLMLEGVPQHEAAERTGLNIKAVYAAKKAAALSGVRFPNLKESKKPKGVVNFPMDLEDQSDQTIAALARAAETRGIPLTDYMARRRLAIRMAQEGRHIRAIMEATKEGKVTLANWFTVARSAGFDIPYMIDAAPAVFEDMAPELPEPAPEPEAATAEIINLKAKRTDRSAFPLHETELDTPIRRKAIETGASLMNLTVQQFLAKRRQAIELYREGKPPSVVARTIGITQKQASNWRERAMSAGRLRLRGPGRPRKAGRDRGGAVSFAVSVAELTPRGLTTARKTAEGIGLTLEDYMDKRAVALGALIQGQTPASIARKLKLPRVMVQNWKTLSRQAGLIETAAPAQAEA